MKEEAALLGAGSLQGVPEQDLQVTLCFAQEDKVWSLKSPRAEDVRFWCTGVPAIRRLVLNNWLFSTCNCAIRVPQTGSSKG
jgi:hypothetical protein